MFRISIDVGGTFTDLVALNEETGDIINIKAASIPKNPEKGVIVALRRFLEKHDATSVIMIGHATTIATNALFGQVDLVLPKTALITTEGFKDIIEIGRQRRSEVYNLFFQRPHMLVSRKHRYEVIERVNQNGEVESRLDEKKINEIIDQIRQSDIHTVAVGFLNSYANAVHEIKTKEIVEQALSNVKVTISTEVSNEYREYERFSTAVINAMLMPIIHTYITRLEREIKEHGFETALYVMQSNGGMARSTVVSDKPATIVESGPASGVIASSWLGQQLGVNNLISFDMGGTTAKAGTVRRGIPEVVPEYEVAGKIHMGRIIKGSGYPVRFPFIDLAECSAGGGTIAKSLNGSLVVGPMSAGALPGPACYGKGGNKPTITDANLILGRLNPTKLLNGEMKINPQLSRKVYELLAAELGMNIHEAAKSVIRIANSMMSKILRIVSVERGYDPRNFTLVAFGGAGPMHACALAEELEIKRILIPLNPGMFSALGLLTSDLFHDYSKPILMEIDEVNLEDLENSYKEMGFEGKGMLRKEGILEEHQSSQRSLDMRYKGQGFELNLKTAKPVTEKSLQDSITLFHDKHKEIYGYSAIDEQVEIVNTKLRVIGFLEKPSLKKQLIKNGIDYKYETRNVYFESIDTWLDTPIIDRNKLLGNIKGPAIIEQYDATTVLYPGWNLVKDLYGNLKLRRSPNET